MDKKNVLIESIEPDYSYKQKKYLGNTIKCKILGDFEIPFEDIFKD